MTLKLLLATSVLHFALTAAGAHAATVYTNQANFDAAVAGLTLQWSEDFEGFTPGVLPAAPLSIGSGQATIFSGGPQQILVQTETGNLGYWNIEDGLTTPTIIQGLGPSPLSANALSFNYNMGGVGDDTYVASFISTAGILNTFLSETSVSYPFGENGQDVPLFLGWVGAPGELLNQIILAPPATGIVVDNIQVYTPLPAALPLYGTGLGLMALFGWWRRRRAVA